MIIKHDAVFEENVLVKGDMEVHGDLTIEGTLTVVKTQERIVYANRVMETKLDLLKALIGLETK